MSLAAVGGRVLGVFAGQRITHGTRGGVGPPENWSSEVRRLPKYERVVFDGQWGVKDILGDVEMDGSGTPV